MIGLQKDWHHCKKHNMMYHKICPLCNNEVDELKALICQYCNCRVPLAFWSGSCVKCGKITKSKYLLKDCIIKR